MKIKEILIAIANKTPLQQRHSQDWAWHRVSPSEILKELVSYVTFTDRDLDANLPVFRVKPQEIAVDGVVFELPTTRTLPGDTLHTVKVGLKGALAQSIPRVVTDQIEYVKESLNYFDTAEDAQLVADLFNAILKETKQ